MRCKTITTDLDAERVVLRATPTVSKVCRLIPLMTVIFRYTFFFFNHLIFFASFITENAFFNLNQ